MAIDTSSTNNKDTWVSSINTTTNFGTDTTINCDARSSVKRWAFFNFTLPSGSGTITKVTFYGYYLGPASTYGLNVAVNEMTRTNWTETGATWNTYDGTNNWTTTGGDFSSTVIHEHTVGAAAGWESWDLMGGSATNPLTLNWGDDVNFRLGYTTQGATYESFSMSTAEAGSNNPYLEITYTVGGATYRRRTLLGVGN